MRRIDWLCAKTNCHLWNQYLYFAICHCSAAHTCTHLRIVFQLKVMNDTATTTVKQQCFIILPQHKHLFHVLPNIPFLIWLFQDIKYSSHSEFEMLKCRFSRICKIYIFRLKWEERALTSFIIGSKLGWEFFISKILH